MSEWDSDIASLLDDVLQDKEPEPCATEANESASETGTAEAVSATPDAGDDKPEQEDGSTTTGTTEALSPDTPTLADLLADDGPDVSDGTDAEGFPGGDERMEQESEATTVVNADVDVAQLPQVDFSTPVEDDDECVPLPEFTTEELMDSIDVRNFGTLVSLTNRRWHAKIKDRKAAKDAANTAGATAEIFEARKRLLAGADEKLKAVHKCIDAARTDHYGMTLPWSTVGINDIGKRAGPRLLPNTRLFEYSEVMGKHKAEMLSKLDDFVDAYPTLIAIAQQKMGTAFNQSDYPHPQSIRDHFALEFDFEPIPQGGDFQGLQDAQAEKLAGALQRKTRQRLENALQDAWTRLYEDVKHAAAVLTNPDAVFHYTLVDKLRDHAGSLKHLNVTKDPRLESVRAQVEKELTKHDAADVRKDDALRKRLGEAACKIRDEMEGHAA